MAANHVSSICSQSLLDILVKMCLILKDFLFMCILSCKLYCHDKDKPRKKCGKHHFAAF